MANQPDTKLRTLRVLKILQDKTDEENSISTPDIIAMLSEEYGIEADRKAIYRDFNALRKAGFRIEKKRNPYVEYWLRNRPLSPAQLRMVVNAIQSSPAIDDMTTDQLMEDIGKLASEGQREALARYVDVPNRVKTEGESVFANLDEIQRAIGARRKVSFQYFEYDARKNRVPRRGGRFYLATPVRLLYTNGFYYLVAHSEEHDDRLVTYRVDRMKEVGVAPESAVRNDLIKNYDPNAQKSLAFGMFDEGTEKVTLKLIDPSAMNVIIDTFGPDVDSSMYKNSNVRVRPKIVVTPQFYGWLFSLRGKVELESPKRLVREYENRLAEALGDFERNE